MAVQGAAPNKMAPAKYSLAMAAGSNGSKTTMKKNQAIANIVKGLISQFTVVVITSPLGCFPTLLIELKSICNIIGKIIAQISTATGIDTCAYSKRDKVCGITGANCPSKTPARIAKATQRVR